MNGKNNGRNKTRSIIRKGRYSIKRSLKMNTTYRMDYPYVGWAITDWSQLNPAFKAFIEEKDKTCTCQSYGQVPCVATSSITSSTIVVLKYDDFIRVSNRQDNLSPLLGHAVYIHGSSYGKYWVCIYNVCSHVISTGETGKGSILFSSILRKLKEMFPMAYMWLGVDPENKFYIPALKSYCKQGFSKPFVVRTDPLGNDTGRGVVALIKAPETLHDDDGFSFAHGVYLYNRYKAGPDKEYKTNFLFSLDENTITSLRALVYTQSFTDINGNYNTGISPQAVNNNIVEYGGELMISKASVVNDKAVFTLSAVKNPSGFLSGVIGQPESVMVPYSPINYHTHPINAYINNKRLIGPPSPGDLVYVYNGGKVDIGRVHLHLVITIEGIYFIASNPQPHIDLYMGQDAQIHLINRQTNQDYIIFQEYTNLMYSNNSPITNFAQGDDIFASGPNDNIRRANEVGEVFVRNNGQNLFGSKNDETLFVMRFAEWDFLTNKNSPPLDMFSSSLNQLRPSPVAGQTYPILLKVLTEYTY